MRIFKWQIQLPHRRSVLAALRLSVLYAASVTVLFTTLLVFMMPRDVTADMFALVIPFVVCFSIAMLLLASARRVGFTALWILLLGLWAWSVFVDRSEPLPDRNFVFWSILAAPLYAIVALGFPGAKPTTARSAITSLLVFCSWAALVVVGLTRSISLFATPSVGDRLLEFAWLAAPVALTARAIARIHRSARESAPSESTGEVSNHSDHGVHRESIG
ncbi:MAG TPA: hypothetical protein VFT29_17270 [Gemmatimonadaceae bacterium]|nr:hypothetical protein [Gemmatimonadaceae bacterium]